MLTANSTTFSRPTSFTRRVLRGLLVVIEMLCLVVLVGPGICSHEPECGRC